MDIGPALILLKSTTNNKGDVESAPMDRTEKITVILFAVAMLLILAYVLIYC